MPSELTPADVVAWLRSLGYDPQPGWPHAENVPLPVAHGREASPLPDKLLAYIDAGQWPAVDDWLHLEAEVDNALAVAGTIALMERGEQP